MFDLASSPEIGPAAPAAGDPVARLRATFESGRTRPLAWRRQQLSALLDLLTTHEADLVEALHADLGRPDFEAYGADIGTTKVEVRYLLRHLGAWVKGARVRAPVTVQPGRARTMPEPLGVGLVIGPWNYPVALVLQPLAAALGAGNCVVVKPSELAPATSAALARLLPGALDPDAVAVVEGGVAEATALLEQPFDHIFFTGSAAVGRTVMAAAARHLTPVVLELGGKSPTVVAADANLAVAARRIMWGKHMNAGQTCVAPDYVLVEAPVRDELVERMAAAAELFAGGRPAAPGPHRSRIVNHRHLDRLLGLLGSAGGTVALGGDHDRQALHLSPTIIVEPDLDAPVMQDEIFGPLLPVIAVDSIDEAVRFVNARPRPLALYVFTSSSATADDVLARTTSGGACVNHTLWQIAPPGLPFGGVGPSGMGAYHGRAGFDTYTHHKAVLRRSTFPDPKLLYPPYNALKQRLIRAVM